MTTNTKKVNNQRQNAQTSRRGWKPRKTSEQKLAEDIAHSISTHPGRIIEDYKVNDSLAAMVSELLQTKYAR